MKRLVIAILAIGLMVQVAMAESSASVLQHKFAAIKTLQADFVQTVYDQAGQVVKVFHGSLVIQRPGELRWRVKQPLPQLIIIQGDKVSVYDPGLEQLTLRKLSDRLSEAPARLLMSPSPNLFQDYQVTQQGESYTLVPKIADRHFHQIVVTFKQDNLTTLWVENALGQRILLHLLNIRINQPVDASLFHFVPPHGTDILDHYTVQH